MTTDSCVKPVLIACPEIDDHRNGNVPIRIPDPKHIGLFERASLIYLWLPLQFFHTSVATSWALKISLACQKYPRDNAKAHFRVEIVYPFCTSQGSHGGILFNHDIIVLTSYHHQEFSSNEDNTNETKSISYFWKKWFHNFENTK